MGSNKDKEDENFEFNWIQVRKEVGLTDQIRFKEETFTEKFSRKFNDNPLVPIGAVFTAACLTLGIMSMSKGDSRMSQLMMRGRVLAQGFTIVAIVTGICLKTASDFSSDKNKPSDI